MHENRQPPSTPQDLAAVYRRYLASVVLFHLAAADAVGLGATDYQASSILDIDGPMTTGDLAHRLGLSTSATTRLVDRMEAAGYLRRRLDPADRRRVMIEHTPQRPPRLAEILETVTAPIGAAMQALNPEQLEGVGLYLKAAEDAYSAGSRLLKA